MSRICFTIVILIATAKFSFAQINLVPNPSFEVVINCPQSASGACVFFNDVLASSTTYWHNLGCGSADYFNSCNSVIVSVPSNNFGYQNARTGFAYAGLFAQLSSSFCQHYREYAVSILITPLIAGVNYYVEFYVSKAEDVSFNISSDGLGALFSIGEPDTAGTSLACEPINYLAQVRNPIGNYISDNINWVRVSGIFTAAGGEDHITIGNFSDTVSNQGGYYYVDDVFVIPDSLAGNVNVNEDIIGNLFNIFPNPFSGIFIVRTNLQFINSIIMITNALGERILEQKIVSEKTEINLSAQPCGIYFVQVKNEKGMIVRKFVKEQ